MDSSVEGWNYKAQNISYNFLEVLKIKFTFSKKETDKYFHLNIFWLRKQHNYQSINPFSKLLQWLMGRDNEFLWWLFLAQN